MKSGIIFVATLTLAGCSNGDDGGSGPALDGAVQGAGGASGAGGSSGSANAGGSSSGGQPNPNECPLQGQFVAASTATLKTATCSTIGKSSTYYNLTISGTNITMEQYVEKFPMTGTIDAQCKLTVTLTTPLARDFHVTLSPTAMNGVGTYTFTSGGGCTVTDDLAWTLKPGTM